MFKKAMASIDAASVIIELKQKTEQAVPELDDLEIVRTVCVRCARSLFLCFVRLCLASSLVLPCVAQMNLVKKVCNDCVAGREVPPKVSLRIEHVPAHRGPDAHMFFSLCRFTMCSGHSATSSRTSTEWRMERRPAKGFFAIVMFFRRVFLCAGGFRKCSKVPP